jgi:acyl-coenzyme A synthetase/AMP-(fatty) acid ligase
VYGSTETRGAFLTTPKLSAIGAIGKLGPAYQARVVDENEQDVGIGETGELLLKGVCITKGYIKNPEANANAFTKDGYYRTGDLVKRDKDGVFWFMSRCKDLMKYQRTHIYPCEIEHVVLTHPKVLECGVIGIFSRELLTDLPRAYITLVHKEDYEDKERIANEVLQYANGLLPEMKRIRAGIVIKNELKRTTSGKILYLALKEEALNE